MNQKPVFKVRVQLPQTLSVRGESIDRAEFLGLLWAQFGVAGMTGVVEGTCLPEEGLDQKLNTDAWTVDSAHAPRERDWIGDQSISDTEIFCENHEVAERVRSWLLGISDVHVGPVLEEKPQDWNALWRASFLNAGDGIEVPPFWRIIPAWREDPPQSPHWIRIQPGIGFGTGTHETTQLCLEVIGEVSEGVSLKQQPALDFGSGSGILSIALAKLGATVTGVEIDALAIENALENASLNRVSDSIRFVEKVPQCIQSSCHIVVANILRSVLMDQVDTLIQALSPRGYLILSGLIEADLDRICKTYQARLPSHKMSLFKKNEWRAICFSPEG